MSEFKAKAKLWSQRPRLVALPSRLTPRVALLRSVKHLFTKQVTEHCRLKTVSTEPHLPWSWVAMTAPSPLPCPPAAPPPLPTGPLMWGPHFPPPLSPLSPRACPAGTWAGCAQASCGSFSKAREAAAVIPVSSEEPEAQACGDVPEYRVSRAEEWWVACPGGVAVHTTCLSRPQRASSRRQVPRVPASGRGVFPPLSREASLQEPCPARVAPRCSGSPVWLPPRPPGGRRR